MRTAILRSVVLLAVLAAGAPWHGPASAQGAPEAERLLQKAIQTETVDGDLTAAIAQYKKIVALPGGNRTVAAQALLHLGQCYEKLGVAQVQDARTAYERVVREFGDQAAIVAQVRVRLAAMGGPAGARGPVARRLLADASALRGVLAADGKTIRSMDRATGDMVQFEIASGQTSRIANKGPWNKAEEFLGGIYSRDGRLFAYGVHTKDDNYQLRLRNLDGTGPRALPPFEKTFTNVELCDYSPDGSSILAVRGTPSQATQLVLVSTADGSVRILKEIASAWFMLWPASFSPDGRHIAFSFVRAGDRPNGEVFVIGADGQGEAAAAGHPAEDLLLAWTPDGKGLVFLSNRSGSWDIWTVRIDGGRQQGQPELLKKDFGFDSDVLGFSPDGFLYYKTYTESGGLYSGEVDIETGKVLVPPAPLTTRYTGMPWGPQWSPDGHSLLYLSRSGGLGVGNNILTIRSAASGEERFLSPGLRYVNQFSWSLDGRSVVALGWTEKETGLFRVDADTSALTKLPVEAWAGRGLNPRLGPDGKTLVFVAEGPSIRKRNLETGEESEVVNGIASVLYDLSPDGREVVFQADGALKIASVNGGGPRELYRSATPYYRPRWTKDGRYIIAEALGKTTSEIWRIPVQGGTPLKLDLSIPKLNWFALHPDNRRFAFSTNEGSRSELWVLENLLPATKPAVKR